MLDEVDEAFTTGGFGHDVRQVEALGANSSQDSQATTSGLLLEYQRLMLRLPRRASPVPLEGGRLVDENYFPLKDLHLLNEIPHELLPLQNKLLHAEPALVGLLDPEVPHPELLVVAAEGGRRYHNAYRLVNALASLDESEVSPLLQTILLFQKLLNIKSEFQWLTRMVANFI